MATSKSNACSTCAGSLMSTAEVLVSVTSRFPETMSNVADALRLLPFDPAKTAAALGPKPVLVIRGERSDLLTAQTAAKMQAVAPDMKLAVVPGVGHAPELNEPEAIAAIEEFLFSR